MLERDGQNEMVTTDAEKYCIKLTPTFAGLNAKDDASEI